jgi:hypothetical protein
MFGVLAASVAVLIQGIPAVEIKINKLKLRQSKYLNFNNLLKISVLTPHT